MKLSIVRLINFRTGEKNPPKRDCCLSVVVILYLLGWQAVRLLTKQNSRTNISYMNNIRYIRQRLGLSQTAFGEAIGVSQGNVSFYELGQDVPPKVARKIIAAAARSGIALSYDDIYSDAEVAA